MIYPGVTLNMGTHRILVNAGELEIIGTDTGRVRLKSDSSNWGGISIGGDAAGTAVATINGAYIDGLSDTALYIGVSASEVSGAVSLTNSRIHISTANRQAAHLRYIDSGTTCTFRNNIIVFPTSNYRAFDAQSTLGGGLTFNIEYNTIVGKASSGSTAITIPDTDANTYNISRNLITGGYDYAISQGGAAPVYNITNNILRTRFHWDGNGGGGGGGDWDVFDDNLVEAEDGDPDNFGATWDTEQIFADYDNNDFTLVITSDFPTLALADNIASMVGSLTVGHENEVGGYGDGGYPPNYNE